MAQAGVLLALLLSLAVAVLAQDDVFLPAYDFGGFEIIFSNDTSFLDEIDSHGDIMYVSGEGLVREVKHDPFSLDYNPRFFAQAHRFIDFKAFNDINNNTWVFGPTTAHHLSTPFGFSHPLQLSSLQATYSQDLSIQQVMLSAVLMHTTADNTHLAYTVGWAIIGPTAHLVLVRLTVTPETAASGNVFTSEAPVSLNSTTGYDDFYRTFKPKTFRNGNKGYVVVVDPSSKCIYKLATPGDDTADPGLITFLGSACIHGEFGGITYDHDNELVYVGLAMPGTLPGYIVVISTISTPAVHSYMNLTKYQSNPSALFYRDNILYIGFSSSGVIIRHDLTAPYVEMTKYSTVPFYLRNVAAMHARHGNLYFVTYDQFAKVAKVDPAHFCYSMCDPFYGYCNNTECKCVNGTTLDADGHTCRTTPVVQQVKTTSKAGEVALGLLFAITLVGGVIGWFLLWKTRRNSRPGGYSTARTEEHNSFLGDEDN